MQVQSFHANALIVHSVSTLPDWADKFRGTMDVTNKIAIRLDLNMVFILADVGSDFHKVRLWFPKEGLCFREEGLRLHSGLDRCYLTQTVSILKIIKLKLLGFSESIFEIVHNYKG